MGSRWEEERRGIGVMVGGMGGLPGPTGVVFLGVCRQGLAPPTLPAPLRGGAMDGTRVGGRARFRPPRARNRPSGQSSWGVGAPFYFERAPCVIMRGPCR